MPISVSWTSVLLVVLLALAIPYPTGSGSDKVLIAPAVQRFASYCSRILHLHEPSFNIDPWPSGDNQSIRLTVSAPRWINSIVFSVWEKQSLFPNTIDQPTSDPPDLAMSAPTRTPVYFLSHGGPSIMFSSDHPAHSTLRQIGQEITQQVRPKAVVVFSAHWQSLQPNVIEVNTAETMPLIYDFYGFPSEYYKMRYPHRGSPELAGKVIDALGRAGIKAEGVRRGLDHGVWAGFYVMFDPRTNPLNVPIVQVSLWDDDENAERHIQLGRAVAKLREEGVLVICSGMSVHNLREMGKFMGSPRPAEYAISFDEALKEAVESPLEGRDGQMVRLLERKDARKAHPSFDHLMPVHVAVGAAGNDAGKQLWTMTEQSMAWGQYRFGDVPA